MLIGQRYNLIREIGRGGSSSVWLAEDVCLHKYWAVKILQKKKSSGRADSGLPAEASVMTRLDHPSLPRIVDVLGDEENIYIVMDYITGITLEDLLKRHGAFSVPVVRQWGIELCDVLTYLHMSDPPIIHRDLKLSNIIVQENGHLKLVDFGISANLGDRAGLCAPVGTRAYAAPEQKAGEATDTRTDIFSLGVVLRALLSGRRPGSGRKEAGHDFRRHLYLKTPAGEGMAEIVKRCTAPDPERRYPDCRRLKQDLLRPEVLSSSWRKKQNKKRRHLLTAVVMAALLSVLGISYVFCSYSAENREYQSYLNIAESTPFDEKIESYFSAAGLSRGDTTPFLLLVRNWQEKGAFDEEDNRRFTDVWNQKQEAFREDDDSYQELLYETGILYFYYYTGGDDSFRTRIRMAKPFFEKCRLAKAAGYCAITAFSDRLLLSGNSEPMKKEDYEQLFMQAEGILKNGNAGGKMEAGGKKTRQEIFLVRTMVQIINSGRNRMKACGYPEEDAEGFLEGMKKEIAGLQVSGAEKGEQEEVLAMIETCGRRLKETYEQSTGKS